MRCMGGKMSTKTRCNTDIERSTIKTNEKNENLDSKSGVLLSGFLKTRYVDMKTQTKKFGFALKSSWKLRHWRITMENDGVTFEKSRCANSRPYKSFALPLGSTWIWESWGKRGDTKYCFGFVLRVASSNLQIEVAVDSEHARCEWINVIQSAVLNQDQTMSESTENLSPSANDIRKHRNSGTTSERNFTSNCIDLSADGTIPRRYNADVYDDEGYMSDNVEKNRSLRYVDNLPKIFDRDTESDDDDRDEAEVINVSDNPAIHLSTIIQKPIDPARPNPSLSHNCSDETSTQDCLLPEVVSRTFAMSLPEGSERNESPRLSCENSAHSPQTASDISNEKGFFSQLISPSSSNSNHEDGKIQIPKIAEINEQPKVIESALQIEHTTKI